MDSDVTPEEKPERKRYRLPLQIGLSVFYLAMIVVALGNAFAAIMSTDALAAVPAGMVVVEVIFILSMAYPLITIGSLIISWVLLVQHRDRRSLWVGLIPAAHIVIIVLMMLLLFSGLIK